MRKLLLMLGICLFPLNVGAKCTATPECTDLGYTKSKNDCPDGGVQCPWNRNLYYCGKPEIKPEVCKIGSIYYSDGTCLSPENHNTGKEPLGVVVYVTNGGLHGQVMAPWGIDVNGDKSDSNTYIAWSTENVDISNLPNHSDWKTSMIDFNSCSNTDKILKQGNASTYPAAYAARKYAPTIGTKDKWCLPAAGVMTSIYNNQKAIKAGIDKIGGKEFPSCCTWSSSEGASNSAWFSFYTQTGGVTYNPKSNPHLVRPVLEFQF